MCSSDLKLLFMGQEFAQWQEWSEARSLDWGILEYERHAQMQKYVQDLNHLYKKYSAFYAKDCEALGFEWLDCCHPELSLVAFIRRGTTNKNHLLFICNFTPVQRNDYAIGVPSSGNYTQIFNSDSEDYGGGGRGLVKVIKPVEEQCQEQPYRLQVTIPPLAIMIFRYNNN